jgi:hypothetical protein
MSQPTAVVFRTFRTGNKETIALFPYEVECRNECASFMHVGQHSSADYHGVISTTRAATADEEARLTAELTSEPYNYTLRPIKRRSQSAYSAAIKAFNAATY